IRPMNIFVVSEAFERPIHVETMPVPMKVLSAKACAACHREIYNEWATTMHSRAWTDPYFQADFRFEGSQQICKNCHIPLENQQEELVLGFRDKEKWDPILKPNPNFDSTLQTEGVTCTVCHLREGRILGPYGSASSPHAVVKMTDPNQACVRCHVVSGKRWDTFFRMPPCGTVAEIKSTGEIEMKCVQCHMPELQRSIVAGGKVRITRRHLWRGGHDTDTVKNGLQVKLQEQAAAPGKRKYTLTLANIGAAHYLPTGTPDRHLTVDLRLLDMNGKIVKKQHYTLKRTILWRPFIIEFGDTRLPYLKSRTYTTAFSTNGRNAPKVFEVVIRYHLLAESRRKRIGYEGKEPISYEIFYRKSPL
ncbi:MAG TPA: multiheme c-type cytochrome, partial [Thermodesulfobacteriota bacterium]|nr:multiheme c-type cytochrome [Thermodesulfobacteriota bacterium]